ncbi:uncharacterized protein LOC124644873 [Helicoverpa zea]|uniref:uncharacterized protein LOC124644873 n=1 Tax=Helicoverpa zea TaxID=7113 RepID=UPI001F5745F2|nr:uncharacterized protein LOC124644873 [Helicoverpa zea]
MRESVQAFGLWQWQYGVRASQTTAARIAKMAFTSILTLLLLVGGCIAAPVDDPIRIDLPVYDQPQAGTDVQVSQPLDPENYPGGDRKNEGNFVTYKLQAASNLLGSALNAKASSHQAGIFSAPVPTLESAVEETEGYGSKKLSVKENLQGIVAGIFQPEPIVDTISEEEKYGNSGDKFYSTGKALVGGAEGLSNFVNSILEVPGTIFKQIARAATEKLNNLGGKLIGLNK